MKKYLTVPLIVSVAVLAAALGAYMLVVRPQADKIAKLDEEAATLGTELNAALQLAEPGEEPTLPIKVAEVVELAKALPDEAAVAEAILELNSAAQRAGVEFTSIVPGPPVPGAGYTQMPLQLQFEGNYYNLTELVYSLRNLVTIRDGVLSAHGRLLTIDSLDWLEAEGGFPLVQANLVVSAYVYGSAPPPVVGGVTSSAPPETTAPGTTPATTTTPTTTDPTAPAPTTTAPSEAPAPSDPSQQAAGVTP
jgi:Tfp pilus assembly protein PilO